MEANGTTGFCRNEGWSSSLMLGGEANKEVGQGRREKGKEKEKRREKSKI